MNTRDHRPSRPRCRRSRPIIAAALLLPAALAVTLPGCAAHTDSPQHENPAARAADPLPSWYDTEARARILQFVERTTTPGSPDFIPPDQRIAVFDNDGTLWAEQPLYFQLLFAIDRVKTLAPSHPEWQHTEPFASLLKSDTKSALAGGEHAILNIVAATHAGMTTDEFDQTVRDWIESARHPTTRRRYLDMTYQPMVEVLNLLRAANYKTFIVSGGGVEFMRAFAQSAYGVPPEQVIGSSFKQRFETRNGVPVLIKLAEVDFIDDKEGKPIAIQKHIGRRPVIAFGNSDGDLQMLEWTAAGPGPSLCAFVRHTDAQREWKYDRESHIGRLDRGLDAASARGWLIVEIDRDWKTVFGTPASR